MEPIPPQNKWLSKVKIAEWVVPKEALLILVIGISVGTFNIFD